MMNGCICCTVRGDLVEALKNLYTKIEQFDAVIIETTGLADPAPVAQTFFIDEDIRQKYSLDGIVTVVDARHIIDRLDDEKPEGVENEAVEQVAFADRILLNKIDLLRNDDAKLTAIEKRIHSINSGVQIIRTQQSVIDPKSIINLNMFSLDRVLEFDPEFLSGDEEHEHDPTISSVSCKFEGFLNQAQLNNWISTILQQLGADLFRYKGLLSVAGNNKKFIFQGVGMLFSGGFSDESWKEDETRECRFVFIGKNLPREELKDGFMACKCEEQLRFKKGDKVQANVGEWVKGKVIGTWDDGNPYRIELEDGSNTNVWGPIDTDEYVKAV